MWLPFTLLSASLWATMNVLDSVVIHRYERNPVVVMWHISLWRIACLACAPFLVEIETEYAFVLVIAGLMIYAAAYLYMWILRHLDTSVTQTGWTVESIILSVSGFLFLGESWNMSETLGTILILSAVFLISYWHKHVSWKKTVSILILLGITGAPSELIFKLVMDSGTSLVSALFWYILGYTVISFVFPLLQKRNRITLTKAFSHTYGFHVYMFLMTLILFGGFAALGMAYRLGPLSLVAIVGNLQIFLVMLFAYLLNVLPTTHVPKELLTKQSVSIKLLSFTIAFVGLSLMVL